MRLWQPLLAGGALLLAACAAGDAPRKAKFGPGLTVAQEAEIRFLARDGDLTESERKRRIARVLAR